MDAKFFVVDRDGLEHRNLAGEWVSTREKAILATVIKPGDLVRDVLTVRVNADRVIVYSEADDHRQKVSIGFRVAWGDQYEDGAENLVTEDWIRRIVTEQDNSDDAGVWLGRHFRWSVEPNADGLLRNSVYDSRDYDDRGVKLV